MSLNSIKIRFRRWQARRLFSRKPLCKICNNLDYRRHEETDLENNELKLKFTFSELNRNCPFCRLLSSSIESVVHKDCWDARVEDGNETSATGMLKLVKDNPIAGDILLWYNKSNHPGPDLRDTGGPSEDRSEFLSLDFIIYSRDKVFCSHPGRLRIRHWTQTDRL